MIIGKELEICCIFFLLYFYSFVFIIDKVDVINGILDCFIFIGVGWGYGVGFC